MRPFCAIICRERLISIFSISGGYTLTDRSLAVGVGMVLVGVAGALGAVAALLWAAVPRMIETLGRLIYAGRDRPMIAFAAFLIFSIMVYLPMHLIFGDLSPGWSRATIRFRFSDQPHPALCRIFLYSASVLVRSA